MDFFKLFQSILQSMSIYEDSANFLKDERFMKTQYQTSANL